MKLWNLELSAHIVTQSWAEPRTILQGNGIVLFEWNTCTIDSTEFADVAVQL
jgi:hypothetical protein